MKHRPLASEWWRSSARKALCLKTSYLCCSNGKDFKGTHTGMLEDKDLEVKHSETHKSLKYHWFIFWFPDVRKLCVFHCILRDLVRIAVVLKVRTVKLKAVWSLGSNDTPAEPWRWHCLRWWWMMSIRPEQTQELCSSRLRSSWWTIEGTHSQRPNAKAKSRQVTMRAACIDCRHHESHWAFATSMKMSCKRCVSCVRPCVEFSVIPAPRLLGFPGNPHSRIRESSSPRRRQIARVNRTCNVCCRQRSHWVVDVAQLWIAPSSDYQREDHRSMAKTSIIESVCAVLVLLLDKNLRFAGASPKP